MLCGMQSQLTSVPLNSKGHGQGHLVTFAKYHLIRIFWSTFVLEQLGLDALPISSWHYYRMSTKVSKSR